MAADTLTTVLLYAFAGVGILSLIAALGILSVGVWFYRGFTAPADPTKGTKRGA